MKCNDFPCVVYFRLIAFGKKQENKTHRKISHSTVFGLLVPGSFLDQLYRVRREVIKNNFDFLFFFLTHGTLSKQTVRREVKE